MRKEMTGISVPLLFLACSALGQAPPVDKFLSCEDRFGFFGADLRVLNRLYWARVLNQHSDYWDADTQSTQFGSPNWVHSTVIALFDSDGLLIVQNQFVIPTVNYSGFIFGTGWHAGLPGSPVMLTAGRNYYLGVAGGSSVFSNGFNCQMSSDRGYFGGDSTPAPGALSALLLGTVISIRRRR